MTAGTGTHTSPSHPSVGDAAAANAGSMVSNWLARARAKAELTAVPRSWRRPSVGTCVSQLGGGWSEWFDPGSDKFYFYHSPTDTKTWTEPVGDAIEGQGEGSGCAGSESAAIDAKAAAVLRQKRFLFLYHLRGSVL